MGCQMRQKAMHHNSFTTFIYISDSYLYIRLLFYWTPIIGDTHSHIGLLFVHIGLLFTYYKTHIILHNNIRVAPRKYDMAHINVGNKLISR